MLRHNDIDLNLSQRQSVTQWDEVRCSLRSLDPGKPSSREDVSLCDLIFCDQIERLVLELNCANGNSSPLAHRFGRDIHHLRATIARNVSEPFHFLSFNPSGMRRSVHCVNCLFNTLATQAGTKLDTSPPRRAISFTIRELR